MRVRHTDGTYFREPAGLQVLNCVQRAARGGETLLVDGLSVARRMAEEEPNPDTDPDPPSP